MTSTTTRSTFAVAITTSQLAETTDFYTRVAGLEEVAREEGFVRLRDPRTDHTLIVTSGCPAAGVHLEVTVESIPAAIAELDAAGGTVTEAWDRAALCADPDGNPILLLA